MAGKLPASKKIKRSAFKTNQEFVEALRKAGRDKEAEAYAVKTGTAQ